MKNIFSEEVANEVIDRINKLNPSTAAVWGKMNVAQMLAHCNISYEMVYDDIHKRPNAFMKFILKNLVKKKVVSETPYKRGNPTAPQFIIKEEKDFKNERTRLIDYITKTQLLGALHFNEKESHSFGKLSTSEWNNMFYKHLDHHLNQFGV
ncbi:DUF1569 domain-containing protein [Pedobacter nototheniae]|uniref:DUF1569 domain-containing protein n=1 Tax=Pedobacter nototheniae TaxID=2488994 RepID=UPI00292F6BCF|nr:DUF1569 domain-containing protein [Pedobacter nototheniae]